MFGARAINSTARKAFDLHSVDPGLTLASYVIFGGLPGVIPEHRSKSTSENHKVWHSKANKQNAQNQNIKQKKNTTTE